jgi:hypothetical protein
MPHPASLLLVAACAAFVTGCDQIALWRLANANEGTEVRLDAALPATIPFREVDGWILVPAQVGERGTVDFVLDSGASMLSMLIGPDSQLGFDLSQAKKLGAADNLGAPIAAPQSGLDIDLGPITLLGQTALAIPLDTIKCTREARTPPFVGVLGHELFDRYTVEVNFDRHEVTLHDPETYTYSGAGRAVPLQVENRQPYIEGLVKPPSGAPYHARLHVDSGANLDISLFPGSRPEIVVPEGGERVQACFAGGMAEYQRGSTVSLEFGDAAGVELPAQYAVGREVKTDGQHGRLGTRFLRRYNVVFDYARERLILEPRAVRASGS